jgi:hypothetical protein
VDLAHAAVDIHSASERPGSGQQQIERTLRESANQKLRLSEDPPESPGYIRDRTPLKKGQISTGALKLHELRHLVLAPRAFIDALVVTRSVRKDADQ